MNDTLVTLNFGYSELKQDQRIENGRLVTYGYRIDYDLEGNETDRTEPTAYSSLGWDDRPFTQEDLEKLK